MNKPKGPEEIKEVMMDYLQKKYGEEFVPISLSMSSWAYSYDNLRAYPMNGKEEDYFEVHGIRMKDGTYAMDDLGITEEEFNRAYKKYSNSRNNIFSVKMNPETLHSEGIDKSSNLKKEGYYHFTFIISGENKDEAIAINVSEPSPFKVARVK